MRNNKWLYNLQSGFRKSHSKETALICLTDQLLSDLDHDEISGLVFVDYKVFDILLSKLKAYGVTSRELLLLKKCLRGRRSAVVNDGV